MFFSQMGESINMKDVLKALKMTVNEPPGLHEPNRGRAGVFLDIMRHIIPEWLVVCQGRHFYASCWWSGGVLGYGYVGVARRSYR